ncbi:Protein FANTASTIC FOUR 3 [Forsythia ovata]|uniref:Protein FANTASTIC FOUR 3 n=1 Tax=Forsythia ovata TaxID=205694 RepID=A0ABD1T832_9LAMI
MSTIVYQSLVSCFESQVTETTILKMKVVPAPTMVDMGRGSCIAGSDQNTKENLEIGTWSSLQSLSKISTCPKEAMEMENSYVHRKPSFTRLTGKSLELCTENLGSETGTDNITDSNSIFSLDTNNSRSKNSSPMDQQQQRAHQQVKSSRNNKMTTSCRSFPPPLTTMKGSSSLQVRPHRENGRLIIKAVEVPSRHSYLQAERSHGRLRLSFFQDYDSNFDSELGDSQLDDEIKSDSNDGDHELENEEMSEAMDVEMGIEKFQRLSRCKEGGHGTKGLCNWKPAFWVATS